MTVHLDPIVTNDPLVNEMRLIAENAAKAVDSTFTIHDFRMTIGETSFNLIFDLVLPASCKLCAAEAEKRVVDEIKAKKPNCFCVIKVEHPFV